mgnify:FL=1
MERKMPYAIFSMDKPGTLQLRNDTRLEHREFLASQMHVLFAAGPLIEDETDNGIGSVTVLDTEDRAVAKEFAESDPYYKVGLYESVIIRRWKQTIRDGARIAT